MKVSVIVEVNASLSRKISCSESLPTNHSMDNAHRPRYFRHVTLRELVILSLADQANILKILANASATKMGKKDLKASPRY